MKPQIDFKDLVGKTVTAVHEGYEIAYIVTNEGFCAIRADEYEEQTLNFTPHINRGDELEDLTPPQMHQLGITDDLELDNWRVKIAEAVRTREENIKARELAERDRLIKLYGTPQS